MPKKADSSLKTESGIYKSQIKAASKYTGEGAGANKDEAKVESVRVRVSKGWGQKMKDYVASSDKYKSVNSMICDLIQKEVGIESDSTD